MSTKPNVIKIFGDSATHDRYQAILRMLDRALDHHKRTGEQIGYSVLGSRHPKALSNLLPASTDDRAHKDSSSLVEQIREVLMSAEITNKHGVYDIVYNHDDTIEPRLDFYIVKITVGCLQQQLSSFVDGVTDIEVRETYTRDELEHMEFCDLKALAEHRNLLKDFDEDDNMDDLLLVGLILDDQHEAMLNRQETKS